ncbi:hypothetical protein BS78_02G290400 [Paspalum vaginatum]|nr:hypothetical protein BS78_02G290400 [Paspalum vaginatum]
MSSSVTTGRSIKFVTYNVWSCEHVAVYRRIRAICEIIERHDPDVIFLQGIARPPWETKHRWHHRLRAATCSLAGPMPSDTGSVRRRARASAFLKYFDAVHQFDVAVHPHPHGTSGGAGLDENGVLGGDLDWLLRLGGHGDGWVDAWLVLRGGGGGGGGWTYDAVANPMVRGLKDMAKERRRSDRFVCKLKDFELDSIQMLGVEPIPGVTRFDDDGNAVPVLPSHHFGLLLTISPKHN